MQTRGKNSPEVDAKPAIVPEESFVGVDEIAKAVPLVPSDTITSPSSAWIPNPAPALSPAPAPIFKPFFVVAPNSLLEIIRGRTTG